MCIAGCQAYMVLGTLSSPGHTPYFILHTSYSALDTRDGFNLLASPPPPARPRGRHLYRRRWQFGRPGAIPDRRS